MKFLLDTNAVISLLEGNQMFANRLRTYQPSDFGMPSIVHHELCFGAYKSKRVAANLQNVHSSQFEVLPISKAAAERAAETGKPSSSDKSTDTPSSRDTFMVSIRTSLQPEESPASRQSMCSRVPAATYSSALNVRVSLFSWSPSRTSFIGGDPETRGGCAPYHRPRHRRPGRRGVDTAGRHLRGFRSADR